MGQIADGVLFFHIVAGAISLLAGFGAIASRKGRKVHRRSGLFYYYGMWGVFLTALFLAVYGNNIFLFMVGFFSFFFVWIGRRMLYLRPFRQEAGYGLTERRVCRGVMMVCGGLAVLGFYQLIAKGEWFGLVPLIFAYAGGTFARRVIFLTRNKPEDDQFWLYGHIIGMGGGYIATVTAFLVVNLTMVPSLFRWIIPVCIGTFMIQRTIYLYKKRAEAS